MDHYLIRYKPNRDTFLEDSTDEEQAQVGKHFEYLKSLLADGRLILAGRTDDAEVGIAVIKADNDAHAQDILAADPAVKSGVFLGSVKLFRLALIKE